MQGRLRNQPLEVTIDSVCAQSGRPIRLQLDRELQLTDNAPTPKTLVFMPTVDWSVFDGPNILDVY